MNIEGHGIRATLPAGWEGAIRRRKAAPATTDEPRASASTTGVAAVGEITLPTAHLATVALPPDRGDFGSGAVDQLGRDDAFVALVEYGAECADTAMFPVGGIPVGPTTRWFNRRALQRSIDRQVGFQRFFTHRGRAFCLYVVLGRDAAIDPLVARVRRALRGISVERR